MKIKKTTTFFWGIFFFLGGGGRVGGSGKGVQGVCERGIEVFVRSFTK